MQKIKKLITELRKCKSLKDMRDASWLILRNGVYDFSWQDWCRQLSDEIYIAHEQDMADYAREMFPDFVPCDEFDIGRASVEAFQRECVRHDMVERLRNLTFPVDSSYVVLVDIYEAVMNKRTGTNWIRPLAIGREIRDTLIEVLAKNELESAPIEDECEDYVPSTDPITGELRSAMVKNPECEGLYMLEKVEFDRLCDAIDAVCANMAEEVKDARNRQIEENIHREVCDALQSIKSLSGPYRNMVNNYDSVRASRDRWKAKAKKAERQADLMEQMLRDARDEFEAREVVAEIKLEPYVTDANGERIRVGDTVKNVKTNFVGKVSQLRYVGGRWTVNFYGDLAQCGADDVVKNFDDSIEDIIDDAMRANGYSLGNRDFLVERARKLAGGADD